jgi:hypothetical protein
VAGPTGIPAAGDPARERLIDACSALRDDAALADLPQRVSLFGLTRLPASYFDVLTALAHRRDVHLLQLHPLPAMWDKLTEYRPPTPGRAVLARKPARAALGYPGPGHELHDRSPATVRGQMFPSASSLSRSMSRAYRPRPLQALILLLELFESLVVLGLHAAVLVTPPMERLLGDLKVSDHLLDRLSLHQELVGLRQ